MKKLVVTALMGLSLVACEANTTLEKKVDQLALDVKAIKDSVEGMGRGGGGAAPGAAARPPAPRRPTADPSKTYAVTVDGLPFEGPADAKVTIVKGYEYACPYCQKVNPTIDELMKKYGNDLKVVYKQFVVHPTVATAPAVAVCAAAKQGKFTPMNHAIWDKVFTPKKFDQMVDAAEAKPGTPGGGKQQCFESEAGCANLEAIAKEIGLDLNKFKADMKGDCATDIRKQQAELSQMGMSATPGFFINGRFLSGAQPIDAFSAVIDEELKKANERIAAGTKLADYYKTWVVEKGMKAAEMPK